jgi:hypothetical protein
VSKYRWLAVALLVALLLGASALPVASQTPTPPALPGAEGQPLPQFVAAMLGCAEPQPIDTMAEGAAVFQLSPDGNTMTYAIWAFNIRDVTEAHIHLGPQGEPGPIVVWLYPSVQAREGEQRPGRFDGLLATGSFTADDLVGPLEGQSLNDLVREMRAGNTFANTHTTANPAGEIRGQIISTAGDEATPGAAGATLAATPTGAAAGPIGTPSPGGDPIY